MVPASEQAARALAEMDADMRGLLVEQLGMEIECLGGNCFGLALSCRDGWRILATGIDGHLPWPDSWALQVYHPRMVLEDGIHFDSDGVPSFAQALAGVLAIAAAA